MKSIFKAGIIIVLFVLAIFSGCIQRDGLFCNYGSCVPPDVCCNGNCYRQCPVNTIMSEDCACIILAPATVRTPTIVPNPGVNTTTTNIRNPVTDNHDGLLVWYDFEDDFPRTRYVTDKSGNNRHAGINGEASTAPGISGGRSIRFSGKGYILSPDNPAARRKNVTFSFWFKTSNPGANYKLASAAWWRGGPGSGWTMATHVPEFWADDTEGVLVPAQPNKPNNFVPGQWNHEVVTYDGEYIREYTNGNLVNSWESRDVPMGEGVPMAVGGWPQFPGYNFVGDLDEFRVYDRPLLPGEVSAIYRGGLQETG